MKVLAINGSPRAQDSCTDRILKPLLEGMSKAGASAETIFTWAILKSIIARVVLIVGLKRRVNVSIKMICHLYCKSI